MDVSVLVPFVPRRPEQILQFAALVQWTNAKRLWQGQATLVETFQQFANAAGAGFKVPLGIGVTLMPLRHPFEAALQARSLVMTTGQSLVAGFGPGATVFQRSIMGKPYASPLTATREYVTIVRRLLDGVDPDFDGEYFSSHGPLPAYPAPRVDVGIGVLRPGMARTAGEVADAAITWLTPAPYVRDVLLPAMQDGAAAAARPVPKMIAMVPVAVRSDTDPIDLVLASNGVHMTLPHYIDMLHRSGIEVAGADRRADAAAVLSGSAFLHGDVEEIAKGIAAYADAGVDELILNLTGVCHVRGPKQALADLEAILTAVA